MRIRIRHQTRYVYDRSVEYTAQLIRLTPGDHAGQHVLNWRVIEQPGRPLPQTDDGYGNVMHMLALSRSHTEATVVAAGEVETFETFGVVNGAVERLPPTYFLRRTPATQPDDAIAALAAEVKGIVDPLERLHGLMLRIRERIDYVVGATTAVTAAAEALAAGQGVCQDHAHVFGSAARCLGVPARYVSGYLWQGPSETPGEASHAWAEAYVAGLGWVGFDAANGVCPNEAYVRAGIGLDYHEAAPVRGVRRGVAQESLSVSVEVHHAAGQQ